MMFQGEGASQKESRPLGCNPAIEEGILQDARRPTRPTLVSLEGIPGSGKSDIINALARKYKDCPEVVILREPLHDMAPLLLENFKSPMKYSLPFQVAYFLAVEKQVREALGHNLGKRVIVCERSLLAARHVYTPLVDTQMTRVQQEVYGKLFEVGGVRHVMPDEIIFLNTEVDTAYKRVNEQGDADGDRVFTRDYLERCDSLYHQQDIVANCSFHDILSDPYNINSTMRKVEDIIGKVKGVEVEILPFGPTMPRVVSIEGNVGAGKSSLLESVKEQLAIDGRKNIITLGEPVEEWLKVTDGHKNIMQLFYETPPLYAFAFQTLIAITTMSAIWEVINKNPGVEVIICERSLLSSRKVFAEALKDDGALDEIEMRVYESIFDDEIIRWMQPEEVLYLDTSPEVCLERIRLRNRVGEGKIDIGWLRKYQGYHERALHQGWNGTLTVINGDTSNPEVRKEWVKEVIDWCDRMKVTHFPPEISKDTEDTEGDEKQVVPIDASPREGKYVDIPIKARLGGHVQHIGNRGDTVKELEESIRHYFPQIGSSDLLMKWKEVKGGPWLPIYKEEEMVLAMDTMLQQGRPVARLMITVNYEDGNLCSSSQINKGVNRS